MRNALISVVVAGAAAAATSACSSSLSAADDGALAPTAVSRAGAAATPVAQPGGGAARSAARPAARTRFDRTSARKVAGWIVADLRTVDHRLRDGIGVGSALGLLADDYDYLLDAGTPPHARPARWSARLVTLEDFAKRASEHYPDDPVEATATYEVVRRHTETVFAVLNRELHTTFRVPRGGRAAQ
jgi:hypothetical protein